MNKLFNVVILAFLVFRNVSCQDNSQEEDRVLCTQEVKFCKDGTYVYRNPLNECKFTECLDGSEPRFVYDFGPQEEPDTFEEYNVNVDNVEPQLELESEPETLEEEKKSNKKTWLYVLVSCVGFVMLISLVGGFLGERCLKDKTHRQETSEREQAEVSSGSSSSASSYMTEPTMFDHVIAPLDIPRDVETGLKE